MRSRDFFTCIIPFYNEGKRILGIIEPLTKVKYLNQIICVDDGSTDNASILVKKKYPKITLIKSSVNEGKSQAVFRGLKKVKNGNILLMDADLKNIKTTEIEKSIEKYINNGQIDMIILRNKGDNAWLDKITRRDIVLSGKRILKKVDLDQVMKENLTGYQLEVAINKYMQENHKITYWIDSSSFNPHKAIKLNFIDGLKNNLKMDAEIFSYIGFVGFLKQTFLFCTKELK